MSAAAFSAMTVGIVLTGRRLDSQENGFRKKTKTSRLESRTVLSFYGALTYILNK